MKVTISELRSMIREALQEKQIYQENMVGEAPPGEIEEAAYQENMSPVNEDAALEEAWNELEEAAGGIQEKKEKPLEETIRALVRKTLLEAKKDEKEKPKAKAKKPEPAKKDEKKDKGMYSLSVSQLKAINKLDDDDFNKCLSHMKKGMPVGMALRMCHAKEEKD